MSPKIYVFWDVTTCRLADMWRRFEGPRRLVTLKDKALNSLERSLTVYHSTQRTVPEYLRSSRLCPPVCGVSGVPAAYTIRENFCTKDRGSKYIRNVILFLTDYTLAMLDDCQLTHSLP